MIDPPRVEHRARETAFRELFEATYDDLVRFVERRAHAVLAEDVVAEVFMIAWRRLDDVPTELSQARAWLFTVAYQTLRNSSRSDRRQEAVALRLAQQPPRRDAEADDTASRIDLFRAWQKLSPRERECLALVAWDGLGQAEAAQVLGISTSAFSVRVLRARRRLRHHLSSATNSTA